MTSTPPPTPTPGRLEVLCGPMFAGKSTELLRRLAAARAVGLTVAAFKPAIDIRYHATAIATHTGRKGDAVAVKTAPEIPPLASTAHVVAIDEVHFFGGPLVPPLESLLHRGVRVIAAGLDLDHRGHVFEPFDWLLARADEIVRLSGRCAVCGKPSTHTQRMVASGDRIVVGGAEAYQARCAACFQPGA